jgi:hypothetical protein
MTYYRKQRMESFKRALFAKQLNETSATTKPTRSLDRDDDTPSIWVPGVLTEAGLGAGQLAS